MGQNPNRSAAETHATLPQRCRRQQTWGKSADEGVPKPLDLSAGGLRRTGVVYYHIGTAHASSPTIPARPHGPQTPPRSNRARPPAPAATAAAHRQTPTYHTTVPNRPPAATARPAPPPDIPPPPAPRPAREAAAPISGWVRLFQVFSFSGSLGPGANTISASRPRSIRPSGAEDPRLPNALGPPPRPPAARKHLVSRSIGVEHARPQRGQLPRHQALAAGHAAQSRSPACIVHAIGHHRRPSTLRIGPVRTRLHVDLQRNVEPVRPGHLLASTSRASPSSSLAGDLEDQFVVDLQQHPRRQSLPAAGGGGWRSWPA